MLRDLLFGFMKAHILYHAGREPVYGVWLQEELTRHGYEISPGTLYPALSSLLKDGYLEQEKRVVDGRARKYYRLTPAGQAALDEVRAKAQELLDEICEEHDPLE